MKFYEKKEGLLLRLTSGLRIEYFDRQLVQHGEGMLRFEMQRDLAQKNRRATTEFYSTKYSLLKDRRLHCLALIQCPFIIALTTFEGGCIPHRSTMRTRRAAIVTSSTQSG